MSMEFASETVKKENDSREIKIYLLSGSFFLQRKAFKRSILEAGKKMKK